MRPIFLTSIPKSGTSLMKHILRCDWKDGTEGISLKIFPGKNLILNLDPIHHHVRGHAGCFDGLKMWTMNRTCVFLYRDPRDVIVSWSYAMDKVTTGNMLSDLEFGNVKDAPDRIGMLIEGLPQMLETFLPWLKEPGVHKIRYEDLITCPERVLAPIALELDIPLRELVERSKYRKTGTFRAGRVGDWRQDFTEEHDLAFRNNPGWRAIMKDMGYE